MITRTLYKFLLEWREDRSRKPLILRGARQVGKTTLVNSFGKLYDDYLYFNLERSADYELFKDLSDIDEFIQLLFLSKGSIYDNSRNQLIFIDEVQEHPKIIEALRYFYEDHPELHVIVTGSLLEFGIDKVEKTPVGRVSYAYLHPISFQEYLTSVNAQLAETLNKSTSLPDSIVNMIFNYFHDYILVGGMPEITSAYIESDKNVTKVLPLYAGLIEAYKNDVPKYGSNKSEQSVIQHIMETAPFEIDNRIVLANFGASEYRGREVKEAFIKLEKAQLLRLVYPTTSWKIPALPDKKKRPRLQYLDMGLVNYQLGIHKELLQLEDLNDASRGKLVQQIVYQELVSKGTYEEVVPRFWVREQHGTSSEVDIVYRFGKYLIPIEIKSGASGTLRSLHEYMDRCEHNFAVRLYKGPISIDELTTRKGKTYQLLNLPYFLGAWLDQYLYHFCYRISHNL